MKSRSTSGFLLHSLECDKGVGEKKQENSSIRKRFQLLIDKRTESPYNVYILIYKRGLLLNKKEGRGVFCQKSLVLKKRSQNEKVFLSEKMYL